MLTKFRIHSKKIKPAIECVCDIKDIPKLILTGINGEFEYEGIWYDFVDGEYVIQPLYTSTYYTKADCLEDTSLPS